MDYDASRNALFHPELAQSRFLREAPPHDRALACEAARLAYYRWEELAHEKERLREALVAAGFEGSTMGLFQHPGTDGQGFAAFDSGSGVALIAFRGTQPDRVGDLLSDANVRLKPWRLGADGRDVDAGGVHAGFANTALGLWEDVKEWLAAIQGRRKLIICGHSLGAAIATLLAVPARANLLVTIGSPRVGNKAFVDAVASAVDQVHRYVDCCDVVTSLPPPLGVFEHVGEQRYIDRRGEPNRTLNDAGIDDDRQEARLEYIRDHAFRFGTVLVRDLADHAPHNYLRALWSAPPGA